MLLLIFEAGLACEERSKWQSREARSKRIAEQPHLWSHHVSATISKHTANKKSITHRCAR
eukprot:3884993-Pleurochrysis_carterae.AAC.1